MRQARGMTITLMLVTGICTGRGASEGGDTLRHVLDSITPDLHATMLSATIVRTLYEPRQCASDEESAVARTIVSEIVVNKDRVRECACDTSKTVDAILSDATRVKQYVHWYADDGEQVLAYDGSHCIGLTRSTPRSTGRDPMLNLFDPLAAVGFNRFVSRVPPAAMQRLRGAAVSSERRVGESVEIVGQYPDCDPERHFRMRVRPDLGYSIVEFVEYDRDKRILAEMHAGDLFELEGASVRIVVPSRTEVKKYRYDSYEGDTVRVATLHILQPKEIETPTGGAFWKYSSRARVYDSVLNVNFGRVKEHAYGMGLEEIGGPSSLEDLAIDEDKAATVAAVGQQERAGGYDARPTAILARADEAYKAQMQMHSDEGGAKAKPSSAPSVMALELPKSNYRYVLARNLIAVVIVLACGVAAIRWIRASR